MSFLDDFIAQDPINRDFVDLMGSVRMTEDDVRLRTEQILTGLGFTPVVRDILGSKVDIYTLQKVKEIFDHLGLPWDPDMPLPPYGLSTPEKQQLSAFGTARVLCGAL